uniref:NADH dehydrogenase subunit 6 n=1 Tax=Nectonemertes cf. mirabilis HC-2011 TaxID=992350 RepID=I1SR43_9BILA|nr:NADH dehydrogenase subunit 6 [Nectonemertes cf. mirabilis HC-2011]ADZ05363.1 NADH dehydrogenase subunit 6 [Nectonemertes cf. mirabilis HC-2011]
MILLVVELLFCLFLSLVVLMQQPLSLAMILLVLCFLISVYMGFLFSSWFSLSLFLIYIGGMLVLFSYVLVLVPNFLVFLNGLWLFSLTFFFFFFSSFSETSMFFLSFSFEMFSGFNLFLYVGLGFILFLALISVVKICCFHEGAFRPFFTT